MVDFKCRNVNFQYADNMTDVFKDYNNLDGETPVEFRIPEPTLSLLNLPTPFEAQYVKFKILVRRIDLRVCLLVRVYVLSSIAWLVVLQFCRATWEVLVYVWKSWAAQSWSALMWTSALSETEAAIRNALIRTYTNFAHNYSVRRRNEMRASVRFLTLSAFTIFPQSGKPLLHLQRRLWVILEKRNSGLPGGRVWSWWSRWRHLSAEQNLRPGVVSKTGSSSEWRASFDEGKHARILVTSPDGWPAQ